MPRRSVSAARRRPPTFNQIVETFTNPVNGSPWAGWTTVAGTVDIQSNKGRTETAATIYASAGAYLNAATPSDFELAGNATITTVSAAEFYGSINVRAGSTVFESVHQANAWNIRFQGITGVGQGHLYKTDAAGNATPANVSGPNINFVQGSILRFRINCTGPRIRVRYWKNAEAEPSTWGIDYTDPTAPTGTKMSVFCRNGGAANVAADRWDWDDITVTDLGTAGPPGTVTGTLAQTLGNVRSTSGAYDFTVSASLSLQQICDQSTAVLTGKRVLVPPGVWQGGLYLVNKNFGGLVIHFETGAVLRGSPSGIEMYGEILNLTIEGPGVIEGNGTQATSEGIMIDAARTDKDGNGNAGGNITIDGLTVRPTPGTGSLQRNGIGIWGCGGSVIVKNCTVHDCAGNTFGFGGAGSGISIGHARRIASAGSMLIDNNLIYNCLDTTGEVSADRNGVILDQFHGNWGKYADYFIGPVVVSNNTIHDVSGRGIHVLCGSLSDSQVTITGNQVYGQWARRLGTDPYQGNPKTAIGGYGVGLGSNVICSNNTVTFDSGNGGKAAYEFVAFNGPDGGPGVLGSGNRVIGTGTNVLWDDSRTDTPPADFMIGGGATGGGVHWGYDVVQDAMGTAGGHPEYYGPAHSAGVINSMASIPRTMVTCHIGGFGTFPPETSQNVFDWTGDARGVPNNGLDDSVALVRSYTGPTGINAIVLCTAPGWMKPSGNDFAMTEAPTDANEQNFADLCRDVANRYTDFDWFIFWNEYKGLGVSGNPFRWNYQKYARMYNKAWTTMKAARPNIRLGGPYPVSSGVSTDAGTGNASTYPGTPICTFSGGRVDMSALDTFTHFRDNAIGWDFIAMDIPWGNQFGSQIGPGFTWQQQSISKFVNHFNWIRTYIEPVKPIVVAEAYMVSGAATQAQQEDHVLTLMAAIRDNVDVGEGIYLLQWGEQAEPPQPFNYTTGAVTGLVQKLINWEAAQ